MNETHKQQSIHVPSRYLIFSVLWTRLEEGREKLYGVYIRLPLVPARCAETMDTEIILPAQSAQDRTIWGSKTLIWERADVNQAVLYE